ncbi:hypothetical protein L1987_75545 [Smallanthus sonchifolius]|uniref:Uncharacterized protein n=1 Tax=Smallanthus sonchifolius TaxID=185202 RepID=A0ACB9A6Q7_9ASTR|nr:hypothetical protein L1987_75545 [Smallanthus sonchifolius]
MASQQDRRATDDVRAKELRAEEAARTAADELHDINKQKEVVVEQTRPGIIGSIFQTVTGTLGSAKDVVTGKTHEATDKATIVSTERERENKQDATRKAAEYKDSAAKKTRDTADSAAKKRKTQQWGKWASTRTMLPRKLEILQMQRLGKPKKRKITQLIKPKKRKTTRLIKPKKRKTKRLRSLERGRIVLLDQMSFNDVGGTGTGTGEDAKAGVK